MRIMSDITISPQVVTTGASFMIAVKVTEVATSWGDLCNELSSWQALVDNYTTWQQIKQR